MFFVLTGFISCVSGYVVTNDGHVLTGKIDLRNCITANNNIKNYTLNVRTELDGKRKKYHLNVKEIKYMRLKMKGLASCFIQDSSTYKPIQLNGITYLSQLLKSKENASIVSIRWIVGWNGPYYTANYTYITEYILIYNNNIFQINPRYGPYTGLNGKTYYIECPQEECQNQSNGTYKISSAVSDTAYSKENVYKQYNRKDNSIYYPLSYNNILCFINSRYHQQFEMKDFKIGEFKYNFINNKTIENMLNYILDKEVE
jgi:hypothetical protein